MLLTRTSKRGTDLEVRVRVRVNECSSRVRLRMRVTVRVRGQLRANQLAIHQGRVTLSCPVAEGEEFGMVNMGASSLPISRGRKIEPPDCIGKL